MPIRRIPIAFMILHVLLAQVGSAMHAAPTGGLCDQAAQHAALSEDVPLDVLRAITRVETGRTVDGMLQPWPWTINVEGQGYWFKSEAEAKAYVFKIFKAGSRSFDVGCFQVNYRWHGKAFRSIDAMFDPDANATYAARFLKDLYFELGSWPAAAGAYHSRTNALAEAYRGRFQTVMAQLDNPPSHGFSGKSPDLFTRAGTPLIPMLVAAPATTALGSLVPTNSTATAFIPFN
ncbi:transglycosylase SLT domain-containing protein [Ruegeria sp. NA]|nr:transglycosylase SLT domain-containing protein [Ruegeria sp. NA]MCX8952023.1 transglycosylase SLT domain-containing protein [Ruegeria sp. NA]